MTRAGVDHHDFDTAIGRCTIVWNADDAVVAMLLPDESDCSRFELGTPGVPSESVADIAAAVTLLLAGGDPGHRLATATIDLAACTDFDRRVYGVTRSIKRGDTLTYGEVAARLAAPGAAQAVGLALGRNPIPILVPCHRVVGADALGGFSAGGGPATKAMLLGIEGAPGFGEPTLF
ncbi:methylated-DNA--[protein]-cysteine S-methyltransferase [Williamsia sp. CHRR-6]|uniref:methylated-DNA--[protein]-cysteine S-methyltransferase n=1 Tax=Williamsia sp. CHRR-6 TaxID=2835871 RepID=UPI001BDB4CB6|nr:methylated-DNA--[protein]-cysteine S-methyltransferase [Williamsia sp. CHRR-6]MBT0566908.1 methylated-DNA--[protein]-cysteine S-methyltransferase [Williamsia sp. CHRR-6]